MKKRLWLDNMIANNLCTKQINSFVSQGYVLVTSTNVVDNILFQRNLEWFEEHLISQSIVVELFCSPNELTHKNFFWSSCSKETTPAETLDEAVTALPNAGNIIALAFLAEEYGVPKDIWDVLPWDADVPLSQETANFLGLDPKTATRTDVLTACRKNSCMYLFNEYNTNYLRALANQHYCDGFINSNGSITFM